MKKILLIIIFFLFSLNNYGNAEVPYFLDFKYILNQSDAGKKAQKYLKNRLENGLKNISSKEKNFWKKKKLSNKKKLFPLKNIRKKLQSLEKSLSLQREKLSSRVRI